MPYDIRARLISIHSPLAGRDRSRPHRSLSASNFNPLAPRGARLAAFCACSAGRTFQSTRPSRGETAPTAGVPATICISIHSPLAGRDGQAIDDTKCEVVISIHSPLAGRDLHETFLKSHEEISIHSPLAGRDQRKRRIWLQKSGFQSTRPSRGETDVRYRAIVMPVNFNPLAPRGARHDGDMVIRADGRFQSTRPSRGETLRVPCHARGWSFQSTRPSRGETTLSSCVRQPARKFQSTRPSRGETPSVAGRLRSGLFQSTRPSRGETRTSKPPMGCCRHFNPLAPRGARR